MSKLLQGMNPHRYDFPTENQIKSVIGTLRKEKKRLKEAAARERRGRGDTSGLVPRSVKQKMKSKAKGRTKCTDVSAGNDGAGNDVVLASGIEQVDTLSRLDGRCSSAEPTEPLPASSSDDCTCTGVDEEGADEHANILSQPDVSAVRSEVREIASGAHAEGSNGQLVKESDEHANGMVTKSTKFRYKMPELYAHSVRDAVLENGKWIGNL